MITRNSSNYSNLQFQADDKQATIFTTTTFLDQNYETKLVLDGMQDNKFLGNVTSDLINCRFVWNKNQFPQPWVAPLFFNSKPFTQENQRIAQAFVLATIGSIAKDAIGEYHPVSITTKSVPTEPHISQLIKAGHLRRPHLAKLNNHDNLIIRKGTVANATKLNKPLEETLQSVAKLLNEAVATNTDKFMMSFELWRQLWHGQWIANKNGIENEHEAYRKHCHDKLKALINEKTNEITTNLSPEQKQILATATKIVA